MPSPPLDDTPDRQALQWLIALQEQPDDPGLHQRFEQWRRQSPDNETAWRDLAGLDGLIVAAHALSSAPRPATPQPTPRPRGGPRRAPIGVALGLALAASAAMLVLAPALKLRWQADVLTGTAEIRHVTLADGSRVTVAPGSAITVSMDAGQRLVELLHGEAFFEVRRDPSRPFTARSDDSSARVLGTAFNLRRHDRGAEISVAEGTVQVSRGERTHRLTAGDWIDTAEPDLAAHGKLPAELVAPWRHGQLVVKDRKLAEVVDILRRYHAGTIVLHGAGLKERRVTGIYDLRAPDDALAALVAPLGGRVIHLAPWLLVVSG